MSVEATGWAWKARAGRAKAVLAAMADHADRSGYCFPSHRRLANMCEISESTVHRMIKLLVLRKLVTVERRFNGDGSCRSNGYRLAIGLVADQTSDGVTLTGRGVNLIGGTPSSGNTDGVTLTGGGSSSDTVTTKEPVLYKPPLLVGRIKDSASDKQSRAQENSWLWFPDRVSSEQRTAIAQLIATLAQDEAQQVLDEVAGRMAVTHVRDPIRYCAALVTRLRRGQFRQELGSQIAQKRNADRHPQARIGGPPSATEVTARPLLPPELRASFERARSGAESTLARHASDDKTPRK